MNDMVWQNLRDDRCPSCAARLIYKPEQAKYRCSACQFRISEQRFAEVIESIRTKAESYDPDKNLRDLNNL